MKHYRIARLCAAGSGKMILLLLTTILTLTIPVHAASNPDGVAVIIGNKTYKGDIPDVDYAHNDADAIKRYVLDVLGFDPKNVINLRDASKAEMEAAFGNKDNHKGRLWQYLDPKGGSDILVYYSGHGVPGQNDHRSYMLPADTDPAFAEINGYPTEVLYKNLGKLKARSKTVLIDACFSGASPKGMLINAASPVRIVAKKADISKDMTVLTAASGDQLASWDKVAQQGLFTNHFLDAVYGNADNNKDGRVTAREIKGYLDDKMTRAARRTYRRIQEATLMGDSSSVLASYTLGRPFKRSRVVMKKPDLPVPNQFAAVTPVPAPAPQPSTVVPAVGNFMRAGKVFKDCDDCPEMVVIPAGSFRMGDLSGAGDDDEKPVHQVTIPKSFAVGKYEVTRDMYAEFVRSTNRRPGDGCYFYDGVNFNQESSKGWQYPGYEQTDRDPVACINWDDAKAFVSWMSRKTGKHYRLLSESEWEYAARAKSTSKYSFGNSESSLCQYANGADNSTRFSWKNTSCNDGFGNKTAPVGSFLANTFGLHDMQGNLWEWVEDCYNNNYTGAANDGTSRTSRNCEEHVVRGGSYGADTKDLRSSERHMIFPDHRIFVNGFRIARTL